MRLESAPAFCKAREHCTVAWQERALEPTAGSLRDNDLLSAVRRWMRALESPPASHKKTASKVGVVLASSAFTVPNASTSDKNVRTQRFTKPPAFWRYDARELPLRQNSLAVMLP